MELRGGWVLEGDIKGFFDSLHHGHLRAFLDQRVRDGVLRRTINKWLKAGILEEGQRVCPDAGTPQGGVVSPILANVFLHYVLDQWFHEQVQPRLRGRARLVRYADDFVVVFEHEQDAHRVMDVLPKRFAKYGLTIHPEKTRLVPFRQPRLGTKSAPKGSFDLLGFTHFWGLSRRGTWVVKRKTAKDRFGRALRRVSAWCRANRHTEIGYQQRQLSAKLRGHCGYYGITGNSKALGRFRFELIRVWRWWLDRRSQRARMTWDRFTRLLRSYPLPPARAVRSILRRGASPWT